MTKDEAILEFLKGLRIAFSNASAYKKEHPFFIKSAENFKKSIDTLLSFLNPIKIGVTQKSLFIDNRFWDNLSLYAEIASTLHIRKIKNIEFKSDLTIDELVDFLSTISMPKKEVISKGGVQNILDPLKYPHLIVEELDYSSLLTDEGEEVADIWVPFLKFAIAKEDTKKINEFADNFSGVIKRIKVDDLLADDELRKSIYDFISYLKDKEKERYLNCNKELLKWAIQGTSITDAQKAEKIKSFFQGLTDEDCVEVLEEELLNNERFDYLSLAVFSRLVEEQRNKNISISLADKIRNSEALKTDSKLRKKVKEIFSSDDTLAVSALYRHALSSLAKDMAEEEVFSFDTPGLEDNYRYVLLNLAAIETDEQKLEPILKNISGELKKIIEEKNMPLLKLVWQCLEAKVKENPESAHLFDNLRGQITDFVEAGIIEGTINEKLEIEFFSDNLKMTLLNVGVYLEKIFTEGKPNPYILELFFRFFPDNLREFLSAVEEKHADVEFLVGLMMSLDRINESFSKEILKTIFHSSNNIAKIEVLRTYRRLNIGDFSILLTIFKKGEILLEKEAIQVCRTDAEYVNKLLGILFAMPSPFGINNRKLFQHIAIVEEAKLQEAKDWLLILSKRPFAWNRGLRKRASQALGKLNERKD